eukprot:CAMPEP_0181331246 /NCGR_PEP_ID=MMETSP1101-20121128/24390_1 /TAXON_ID=46948 /ORGANISM="Rhodomonas abbreviata, Strain Caron Lab Isolate" /LENGTH=64 /DNA_ID=CAMNT_0023440675 /DNA_START=263 /DNA_END=453 /DNA_ORIENTATION=-
MLSDAPISFLSASREQWILEQRKSEIENREGNTHRVFRKRMEGYDGNADVYGWVRGSEWCAKEG